MTILDRRHRKWPKVVAEVQQSAPAPAMPGLALVLDGRRRASKRLFWALLLLVLAVTALFQVDNRLDRFHHHPVESVVDFLRDDGAAFHFPRVTLCVERQSEEEPLRPLTAISVNCVTNYGENCNQSVSWKTVITSVGQCLTLALDVPMMSGSPILPALDLVLERTDEPVVESITGGRLDHNRSDNDDEYNSLADHETNYRVLLHSADLDVTYPIARLGFPLVWGHITRIGYTKRLYRFENTHQRPCAKFRIYNRCLAACFDRHLADLFQCRAPFMASNQKWNRMWPACNSSQMRSVYWWASQAAYAPLERRCGCDWPCQTAYFDAQLDSRQSEDSTARRRQLWPVKLATLHRRVVRTRERCSYSFFALLCDTGATIGLYLGVALPSFVELAEQLVEGTWRALSRHLAVCRSTTTASF